MAANIAMRWTLVTVALLLAVIVTGATIHAGARQPAPAAAPISDEAIRGLLVQRVDAYHQAVGIVVGVIDAKGRRIVSYGAAAKGDARPLDGDTVFEIGSITKVFTSLLLADMVRSGDVSLSDPVAKYLPATVKVPARGDRQITLQDLASHSSGLPAMPSNFAPSDAMNPYADYTTAQLYQFLSSYELTRDIGSQYQYSNLGGALLGHALALRAGKDYETLVRERITGPLTMRDTRIALPDEMKSRLAHGHSAKLDPVPNWDLPAFAGAGALRSTANDLLQFLAVPLGYKESPLAASFASMYAPRRPANMPGMEVALAWHIKKTSSSEIIWHNGGTGGYRTFAGFDLRTRTGVVVLSNTSNSVDDIGFHLLDAGSPLAPAPKVHTEKTVDPKIFEKYTGHYQLRPDFVLSITVENNHLMAQATGQRGFELFAEGEREFFAKVADVQIIFEVDDRGRATSLTLVQGPARLNATRID